MNRRLQLYFVTLLSGFINAVVVTMDAVIMSLSSEDAVIMGLAFFLIGVSVNPLIILAFSPTVRGRKLGASFDPDFRGFLIPRGSVLKNLVLAGFANAMASVAYFVMIRMYPDPSAMLTFTSLVSIYLLALDAFVEKEKPSPVEIQAIVTISVGSLLVSFTLGTIDIAGLLIVLGLMNGFMALQTLALKRARGSFFEGRGVDGINARFWLLNFTTAFTMAFALVLYGPASLLRAVQVSVEYSPLLALDMTLTFLAYALYIRALGLGKMSEVNALYSTSILFALFLHLALSEILPFLSVELSGFLLAIKLSGIILTVVGVATLALTEVTAYVFVKVRPGAKGLLETLASIRGVETVSATAGRYDYILRIRIRSLGQAYSILSRELERIPGVADYLWITTLKEWEFPG